nr:MAG TPA: hypothetical protein [Caudoviricetes sp.]DAT01585.1 MAG TPA: hypothetical protein [Caudoviricetes sp.]
MILLTTENANLRSSDEGKYLLQGAFPFFFRKE